MTLKNVVNIIKFVSLSQPNVRQFAEGSVYDINNNPSNKYANIVLTQRDHIETDNTFIFNFIIFYVDRLVDDLETNRLEAQSAGISTLSNIFKTLEEKFDFEYIEKRYTTWTQRFTDECAGAYCNVRIEVYKDQLCAEMFD